MRAIIVDDELLMIRKFVRLSSLIPDLNVIGTFDNAYDALDFVRDNPIEVAFLDIAMPIKNGIELAKEIKEIKPDMMIVFVSAHDDYLRESNEIGADYYVLKPYTQEILETTMEKLRLLADRQQKDIYIQTFGRFVVKRNGVPVPLTGKAKEILALVVTKRGKEISNEEIYSTLWEGRPYSNASMSVYYNALRRLKKSLREQNLENLLISTTRGQIINTEIISCDYYDWKDKKIDLNNPFEGEFLPEYSWGEYILAKMVETED